MSKVDRKEARVYEQYLAHILMELRRSNGGEVQSEKPMHAKSK